MIEQLAYVAVNTLAYLLVAPLFISLIKKVKAWCQGRRGPPLMQTYYNLAKLLRKEVVYSSTSSWIMRVTPYVCMVMLVVACLAVPVALVPGDLWGLGNVILLVYTLAVAKFFMALSGLDAGSTFGGMGASREMSLSAVFEPIIITVFAALSYLLHTTDVPAMLGLGIAEPLILTHPTIILLLISLFIILIVETARVPVDNPETHLELTMIHEAMILEQSGRNLALMEYSYALKNMLFIALLVNLVSPVGLTAEFSAVAVGFGLVMFLIKGMLMAVLVGLVESTFAKYRLFRIPSMFTVVLFFSFLTIILEVFA
jgi:formate hydrogenlyase subunit 4